MFLRPRRDPEGLNGRRVSCPFRPPRLSTTRAQHEVLFLSRERAAPSLEVYDATAAWCVGRLTSGALAASPFSAELEEAQKERLQALLRIEDYQEVEPLMQTTYARGSERGIEQGERRWALRQMEAKFGPLSPEVKRQVEGLSPDALARPRIALAERNACPGESG
jgi:hypothetical protein